MSDFDEEISQLIGELSIEPKKSTKDINSLSYLVDGHISQSKCIKLGNYLEKFILSYILLHNKSLSSIKKPNEKGVKEKDHLFKNETIKTIYYAEIKGNLKLDTEKTKATIEKCVSIANDLKNEFPDCKINSSLVNIRYLHKNEIPKNIRKKYKQIDNMICGLNDYLKLLQIEPITYKKYKLIINTIVEKMTYNNQ